MANISQNQNQTFQTPLLGAMTRGPNLNVFPCQIDPASAATAINVGQAVKLVAKIPAGIVVDVCTGPTDGPVFGVIMNNLKKNKFSPGDICPVATDLCVLFLESGGAINRGDWVSCTPNTAYTNDPTVSTDTTTNHFLVGKALQQCSGSGTLIAIEVRPGLKITAAGVISFN